MKNVFIIGVVVAALLFGGAVIWSQWLEDNDPNIIARDGLHTHPELTIYVKGEKIEIPQNIGLGAVHMPMHTHNDLPVIHLEFPGIVKSGDVVLEQFFKVWGKSMDSFGTNMTMTVNGEENTEYGSYQMKNGDKIELRYE